MKEFFNPSQQRTVTILRILYPTLTIIAIASLMYILASLLVLNDANQTAKNLLSNELLYNLSLAGSLITQLIHIVMVLLFWHLFKLVNRNLAGMVLIFGLVSVPISMFNTINISAAQFVVSNTGFLNGITTEASQSWMMFFLNLNQEGMLIAQIF